MKIINISKKDQNGFASIVIALVLILVISLLTLGFAQLARREQQNALSRQLSIQATYAAETGVNDVIKLLYEGKVADNGNNCLNFPINDASGHPISSVLNSASGVSYSCATVKTKLDDLVHDPLAPDTAWTTIFKTNPLIPKLDSFTIYWQSKNSAGKVVRPANTGLSPATGASAWNSPAVLEVSITPLGFTDRNSLINNTFTTYLYPSAGSGTVAYATNGVTIASGCNSGIDSCGVTITGIGAAPGNVSGTSFLVHILGYYDTSAVQIGNGFTVGPGPQHATFDDAQALIDVTGKAHEVLKRLQVRVPLTGTNPDAMPNYALEAQNICKRFKTGPTDPANNPNGTTFIDASSPFGPTSTGPCAISP